MRKIVIFVIISLFISLYLYGQPPRVRQPGTGYTDAYTKLQTRQVINDTADVLRSSWQSNISDSLYIFIDGDSVYIPNHLEYLSFYHIDDFGAIPDDGNDDYAAIQAAIDSLGNSNIRTIRFGKGDYHTSETIRINPQDVGGEENGIIFQGEGCGYTPFGGDGTSVRPHGSCDTLLWVDAHNFQIRDMTFEGVGDTMPSKYAVFLDSRTYNTILNNVHFKDIRSSDSTATCLRLGSPTNFIYNVTMDSCDYGIYAANFNTSYIGGLKINGPFNRPMELRYVWGGKIENLDIEDGYYEAEAIKLKYCFNLQIEDVYFEATENANGADFIGWYEDDFYQIIGSAHRRTGHSLTVKSGVYSMSSKGKLVDLDSIPVNLIGSVNLEELEVLNSTGIFDGLPRPHMDVSVKHLTMTKDSEPYLNMVFHDVSGAVGNMKKEQEFLRRFGSPMAAGQGDSAIFNQSYINIYEYANTDPPKIPDTDNNYCIKNTGSTQNYWTSGLGGNDDVWDFDAGDDIILNIWVKPLRLGGRFVEKGDLQDQGRWILYGLTTQSQSPKFWLHDSNTYDYNKSIESSSSLTNNQWHMITVTMNAQDTVGNVDTNGGMKLYLDGLPFFDADSSHVANYTTKGITQNDPLEIARGLTGYLDNLSIHKGVGIVDTLSADSIESMYNSGCPIDLTGFDGIVGNIDLNDSLSCYFKFEEGFDADTLWSYPDSSNYLVKNNSPLIAPGGPNSYAILEAAYGQDTKLRIDKDGSILTDGNLDAEGYIDVQDSLRIGDSGAWIKPTSVTADSVKLEIGNYYLIVKSDSTAYWKAK